MLLVHISWSISPHRDTWTRVKMLKCTNRRRQQKSHGPQSLSSPTWGSSGRRERGEKNTRYTHGHSKGRNGFILVANNVKVLLSCCHLRPHCHWSSWKPWLERRWSGKGEVNQSILYLFIYLCNLYWQSINPNPHGLVASSRNSRQAVYKEQETPWHSINHAHIHTGP